MNNKQPTVSRRKREGIYSPPYGRQPYTDIKSCYESFDPDDGTYGVYRMRDDKCVAWAYVDCAKYEAYEKGYHIVGYPIDWYENILKDIGEFDE